VLLPFLGQVVISNRETDSHGNERKLHRADQDVDDPRAPTCNSDSNHHINTEDPGILHNSFSSWHVPPGAELTGVIRHNETGLRLPR
jgi:hypothetical protein